MSSMFAISRDEQAKLLDDALQAVKVQAFQMKRCVDNDRLLDGLKHCSTMLNELRTSALTPKNYYELYLATFDALQYLVGALRAAHYSGRNHLADLYELVQYAGNIVPRLYLMITIGSTYMSLAAPVPPPDDGGGSDDGSGSARDSAAAADAVPVREIMMDMLEMARGVQHPTRGLFLRYYLGQMTKDYLPLGPGGGDGVGVGGSLEDATHFILTNFVEMNKLWVRLQHQGQSRERERREAERRDLRTLVGANLLRLASLPDLPRAAYEDTILPKLLSQVVSCRDTLAQEYLMEALVQAFSDEWHLATVGQLMEAISGLGPKVSIKSIVIPLVDRVSSYAARRREELEKALAAAAAAAEETDSNRPEAVPVRAESAASVASAASVPRSEKSADRASDVEVLAKGIACATLDDSAAHEDQATSEAKETTSEPEEAEEQPEGPPDGLPEEPSEGQPGEEQTEASKNSTSTELDMLASLFDSFWAHVSGLIEARPDLPLHDAVAICTSTLRLSLACNPQPVGPVDSVLAFVRGLLRANELSPGAHTPATANQLLGLLLGPLRAYANPLK
ncbi:retromer complex subunit Vps35, partial [Coemansia spiralis]